MKKEMIKQLYNTFEQFALEVNGIECWSARELQELLGYKKWENFSKVIDKAKEACINVGNNVSDHFPDVRKMVGDSRWDRYLGMTAAMTQVPVPTATKVGKGCHHTLAAAISGHEIIDSTVHTFVQCQTTLHLLSKVRLVSSEWPGREQESCGLAQTGGYSDSSS